MADTHTGLVYEGPGEYLRDHSVDAIIQAVHEKTMENWNGYVDPYTHVVIPSSSNAFRAYAQALRRGETPVSMFHYACMLAQPYTTPGITFFVGVKENADAAENLRQMFCKRMDHEQAIVNNLNYRRRMRMHKKYARAATRELHCRLKRYISEAREHVEPIGRVPLRQFAAYVRASTDLHIGISADRGLPYISFADKPEHKYDTNKRKLQKLGRFLGKRLGMRPEESGAIVSAVMAAAGYTTDDFEILRGDAVEDAYEQEVGGHSCMTGCNHPYVRVYAENPDKVGLLVWRKNEARALIWTTDDGKKFIDRVYPSSGQAITAFQIYAENKNARIRDGHSFEHSTDKNVVVTVKNASNGAWPFMDTLVRQYDNGDGTSTLSCHPIHGRTCDAHLDYQDGGPGYEGNCYCECDYCGHQVDEYDSYTCQDMIICDTCWSEHVTTCEHCQESYFTDGMKVTHDSTHLCETCYHDVATGCVECDEMYYDSSLGNRWGPEGMLMHELPCGDRVCDDCFSDNYIECPDCGEAVHKLDTVDAAPDNAAFIELVCEDCYAERQQYKLELADETEGE